SLHVSDRLVSKGGTPHDLLANKTVLLRAADGLLALGYTGPAYIEGKPTDTWIAETVSGTVLGHEGAVRMGTSPIRDIGWSLHLLCQRLRADPDFQRIGGSVSGVGWQWNPKRESSLFRDVL